METNQNAFFNDKQGNMWFGTIKGLIQCKPNKIVRSGYPPLLYIAGVRVFLVKKKLKDDETLRYDENHITFDFKGIHYTNPSDISYSFKLDGFDELWSPLTTENAATYSNLPPGDYLFKVKARSRDGVWSDEVTFSLHLTPPFWMTWWFQITLTVIIISLIYLIFQLRTRSLIRQRKLLRSEVAQRTRELILEKEKVDQFNEKLASRNELLAMRNKDIMDSIHYAERIQRGMLPGEREILAIVPDNFLLFNPRDVVSGDFYWCKEVHGIKYFAAIDCTGHGVPGAFMSLIGNDLLNQVILDSKPLNTGEVLKSMHLKLRRYFLKEGNIDVNDGMDMALCAIYPDGRLQFSGAKRPLFIIRKGELIEHKGSRFSIGEPTNEEVCYETQEIELKSNDMIYIFSDGYPDQFGGPKGKKFMIKRLKELLLNVAHLPCEEQYKQIVKAFEEWKGNHEQVDDVIVWGVKTP